MYAYSSAAPATIRRPMFSTHSCRGRARAATLDPSHVRREWGGGGLRVAGVGVWVGLGLHTASIDSEIALPAPLAAASHRAWGLCLGSRGAGDATSCRTVRPEVDPSASATARACACAFAKARVRGRTRHTHRWIQRAPPARAPPNPPIHTRTHAHAHAHKHTHTRTRARARTHTHTHTHTFHPRTLPIFLGLDFPPFCHILLPAYP